MAESDPSPSDEEKKILPHPAPAAGEESTRHDRVQQAVGKIAGNDPSGRFVQQFSMMMGRVGGSSIHEKMEGKHISQVLTLAADHDQREFDLQKRQQDLEDRKDARDRFYLSVYLLILVALIAILVITFRQKPEVLVPLLSGIGGLIAGFFGGVGYGKSRNSD